MKFSKFTRDILLTINLDLLEVLIDFIETGNMMYKKPEYWSSIKRFKGFDKTKIIKKLDSLFRQGLIEKIEDKYHLTKRGLNHFNRLDCQLTLDLPKGIPWQGKWYLVIFDIPIESNKDRDQLRRILKKFGLLPIQKSVFVYPHDLSHKLESLENFFPKRHLLIITTESQGIAQLMFNKFKNEGIII